MPKLARRNTLTQHRHFNGVRPPALTWRQYPMTPSYVPPLKAGDFVQLVPEKITKLIRDHVGTEHLGATMQVLGTTFAKKVLINSPRGSLWVDQAQIRQAKDGAEVTRDFQSGSAPSYPPAGRSDAPVASDRPTRGFGKHCAMTAESTGAVDIGDCSVIGAQNVGEDPAVMHSYGA